MTVGERIKARRKQLKMSADELGKRIGKNRATIYRYESSEIEDMPYNIVLPLAEALNVTPAYLMGWEEPGKQIESDYVYIPTSVSAGMAITAEPVQSYNVEKITIPDALMGKWAGSKKVRIMHVNGESMNRTIPHGSLIAVKEIELHELRNGDIVVYSNDHNEFAVKRFYRSDNTLIFRPDSVDPRFTDHIYNLGNTRNLKIHGKVVLYIVELD